MWCLVFTNVHVNTHVYHTTLTRYTSNQPTGKYLLLCTACKIPNKSVEGIESDMDHGKCLPAFGVKTQIATAAFSTIY